MKFRKATKKIVAVASATALASASVFGAANYPSNFVDDGELNATVVVGSGEGASDMNAAQLIVDDLQNRYSEGSSQTTITYRASGSGESISAIDSRDVLNYNGTLEDVREDFDDSTSDLFEDSDLDNDEYTQELDLLNGEFTYRIFDEVDGEETAKAGLFYGAFEDFANFTIDFTDDVDLTNDNDLNLQGEEMLIMGNPFVIESISDDSLTLLGGSNSVALREGDSTTVTVDGVDYDVSAGLISSNDKIVLDIDGVQKTVDNLDSEQFGDVNVVITELLSSSRNDEAGYVEFAIGGQKLEFTNSGVEINGEDLDDVHPDYEVDVDFTNTNTSFFEGFTLTYGVDEDTLLDSGDSLEDVLFDSFELVYEGTNNVDYSTLEIQTSSDDVTFNGEMRNGNQIPTEFKLSTDDVDGNESLYLGTRNKRIFHENSVDAIGSMVQDDRTRGFTIGGGNVTIELNNGTQDIINNMFYTYVADDESYLYKFTSVDRGELDFDFEDMFMGDDINTVEYDDIDGDLETTGVFNGANNQTNLTYGNLGSSLLQLDNLLVMDFSDIERSVFDLNSNASLNFSYNQNDIDMDDGTFEKDSFILEFNRDSSDETDPIQISVLEASSDFVQDDEVEVGSDNDVFVDHYGTRLTIDTDVNKDYVLIEVPSEEVTAVVNMVFGGVGETMSETVPTSQADDRVDELEADGFTVSGIEEQSNDDVEVDVEGPILDTEADTSAGNHIVVGGPAVNAAAREYLGISNYDVSQAGVDQGEFVHKYYEDANSILVYGYSAADTTAAVQELNSGQADFEEE